ncbi:MAG: hypothetical protein UZ09_BCD002001759 [Bacteroidetes bacterium OLB9]|nr:MAG: hypothetical protein UZ09_BCD002001759 [Bacteroidetes bacterium OLB9]
MDMTNFNDHFQDELKEISPYLASLPKQDPKNVPDGYFEQIEDEIVHQLMLIRHTPESNRQLPDGYFDQVENQVIRKIKISKKPRAWIKFIPYVAAASILFILMILVVSPADHANQETVQLAQISEMDQLDYLSKNIDDVSLNTLIDYGLIEESDLMITDAEVEN